MKDWAKKDPKFCAQIHEEYTKLVQLAKEVPPTYLVFVREIMRWFLIIYFCDQLDLRVFARKKLPS